MATNTILSDEKSGDRAPHRSRTRLRAGAALTSALALGGMFLVGSPGASAATIGVTTTADSGPGSLRAAISEANATPGPDVIQVPAGTYLLSTVGQNEDDNATGDLDIT